MGLFGDLFDVVADVTEVVIAPVSVAAAAVKEITGSIAGEVKDATGSIKNTIKRGF